MKQFQLNNPQAQVIVVNQNDSIHNPRCCGPCIINLSHVSMFACVVPFQGLQHRQLHLRTRGLSHCGLAIYIKKYLKAKEK
jgi:hypothetical protein